MRRELIPALVAPVLIAGAALFYALSLPHHPQAGDTAELVAAAYRGLVAHPPGYPLWIWLERAWLLGTSPEEAFWRASFLTALFALLAAAIIAYPLRSRPLALCLCLPALLLGTAFLSNAILPDVFSLHALLTAAIGVLFLFAPSRSPARAFLIPFIFFLGLAHHLTIVALFPVVLAIAASLRNRAPLRLPFALGSLIGILAAASLYASLRLLKVESPFSWGILSTAGAIWHHFLRSDYGTFQLTANATPATRSAPMLHFLRISILENTGLWIMALGAAIENHALLRAPRLLIWLLSCALSATFFLFANIEPTGTGAEVLLRFHAMPALQLVLAAAFLLKRGNLSRNVARVGWVAAIASFLYLGYQAAPARSIAQDSVLETYSRDLLHEAERHGAAILLVQSDTVFFNLRYRQLMFGQGTSVLVLSPELLFHRWHLEKVRTLQPKLQLPGAEEILRRKAYDLFSDLLQPNQAAGLGVMSNGPVASRAFFRTVHTPLGRLLEIGAGTGAEATGVALQPPPLPLRGSPQFHSKKLLVAQYANFSMAKSLAAFEANQFDDAVVASEEALAAVPFAYPALLNLCKLLNDRDPRCTLENKAKVLSEGQGYFP